MSDIRTVWKFGFTPTDNVEVSMPKRAQILSVQMQGNTPQIWALVDPKSDYEKRSFVMVGTGHEHKVGHYGKCIYIGTFQMSGGTLVFHLFEV